MFGTDKWTSSWSHHPYANEEAALQVGYFPLRPCNTWNITGWDESSDVISMHRLWEHPVCCYMPWQTITITATISTTKTSTFKRKWFYALARVHKWPSSRAAALHCTHEIRANGSFQLGAAAGFQEVARGWADDRQTTERRGEALSHIGGTQFPSSPPPEFC